MHCSYNKLRSVNDIMIALPRNQYLTAMIIFRNENCHAHRFPRPIIPSSGRWNQAIGVITVEQRGDGDILVGGCWRIGVKATLMAAIQSGGSA
jgi:hypothetical protein